MPVYFIDSSALVKRYQHEVGSERVEGLLNSSERLILARLTQLEVSAAIVRRARATGLSTHALTGALATFDRDVRDSFEVGSRSDTALKAADYSLHLSKIKSTRSPNRKPSAVS